MAVATEIGDGAEAAKQGIRAALRNDDYSWADLHCRRWIDLRPDDPDFHLLLAEIALQIGHARIAEQELRRALELGAGLDAAAPLGADIPALRTVSPAPGPHYLFIPEWGYGFWADVSHVLGSLLLAELTGRMPSVHWGNNSLFSPSDGIDAFTRYFMPIGVPREALAAPGLSCYPPEWSSGAILSPRDGLVRAARRHGTHGIALLGRTENVVVSDTFLGVPDIIPWVDGESPYHGLDRLEVTRRLAAKYLKLAPALAARVGAFHDRFLTGGQWLGIHFRGADKPAEVGRGTPTVVDYVTWIDAFLVANPAFRLFLLTDSRPALAELAARYPGRLVATDSLRSGSPRGVHYAGHDPVRIAEEVLLDTYLATRCDVFLGTATSNVSIAVEYLKRWPAGACTLLGVDWRDGRFAPQS